MLCWVVSTPQEELDRRLGEQPQPPRIPAKSSNEQAIPRHPAKAKTEAKDFVPAASPSMTMA